VCDLETSRMGAPYIYDISHLRVKDLHAGEETHHSRLQCSLELEAVAFFLKLLVRLVFVFFVTKGTIMITFFK